MVHARRHDDQSESAINERPTRVQVQTLWLVYAGRSAARRVEPGENQRPRITGRRFCARMGNKHTKPRGGSARGRARSIGMAMSHALEHDERRVGKEGEQRIRGLQHERGRPRPFLTGASTAISPPPPIISPSRLAPKVDKHVKLDAGGKL